MYKVMVPAKHGGGPMFVVRSTAAEALESYRRFEESGMENISICGLDGKPILLEELSQTGASSKQSAT